jgi:hypothetical protein
MLSAILFQPLPSALIALAAFFVMIWPGYALLHLAGHGRHRWSAALFAGPAVTLALWIIALSGAAWASVPLRSIFGPVWIATLLLAAFGVVLRLSVNRQVTAAADTRQERLWLWATAAVLPFVVMPATLRYGLGNFVNSTYADPWSYIMVADYLSAVARGVEGGLSALHQYASHLMNARNASSAILAHLAFGFGGVKADQAMAPYCLLLLFANTSALIGFARSSFGRTEAALGLALLAGQHRLCRQFRPASAAAPVAAGRRAGASRRRRHQPVGRECPDRRAQRSRAARLCRTGIHRFGDRNGICHRARHPAPFGNWPDPAGVLHCRPGFRAFDVARPGRVDDHAEKPVFDDSGGGPAG